MPNEALEKLIGKRWSELEAVEHDGRSLFFDSLRKRRKDGTVEEVRIAVRVLRKNERRKARLDAEKWAKEEGIDVEKNAELFDDMDTMCILARAIREARDPYEQHMPHAVLEATYDMRSLEELWAKYKLYEDLTDPRDAILTDKDFWAAVGAIKTKGSVGPLTELGSLEQNSFILRLVDLALISPTFKSWYSQFESSTPGS